MLIKPVKLVSKDFQLPSKGYGYKKGVFSHSVEGGVLTVHPMSTRLEILSKNPDGIVNGSFIMDMCNECVPNQVLSPNEVFHKDMEALMIFIKAISSGDVYQFSFQHDCQLVQDGIPVVRYEVLGDAPEELIEAPTGSEILNTPEGRKIVIAHPVQSRPQNASISIANDVLGKMRVVADPQKATATITLPEGNIVTMTPTSIAQYITAITSIIASINSIPPDSDAYDVNKELVILDQTILSLAASISDIDGISSKPDIIEYLKTLPTPSFASLTEAFASLDAFGVDPIHSVKCLNCQKMVPIELPLDPLSFFSGR